MMCVQKKTLVPDNFHVSPSSTGVEWRKVFKYCRKRKNGNEPIPKLFQYMFGYKGNGDYEHIPWEELVTELTSVGKDTTGDKKLILYLPTKSNYDKTSDEVRESLRLEKNEGNYPSNSSSTKNISKEEDLFPILYPAFTKQLYDKHVSFIAYLYLVS